jgi:hypothetical protein
MDENIILSERQLLIFVFEVKNVDELRLLKFSSNFLSKGDDLLKESR